jgi:hypothetical protein
MKASGRMDGDSIHNTLKGLLLGGGVLLLAWFIAAMCDSKGGEQAAALGGIVAAAGAIYAVYLTLSRQRRDEACRSDNIPGLRRSDRVRSVVRQHVAARISDLPILSFLP